VRLNDTKLIFTRLALAAVLVFVPVEITQALESAPQVMDAPISPELRTPFARFLQELGATNIEEMVNGTKVISLFDSSGLSSTVLGLTGPALTAFRVETDSTCSKDHDLCFTIVAQIDSGEVSVRAMFPAGNRTNSADVITNFLGTRSHAVRFYSKDSITYVTKTAKGVFVSTIRQPEPPL
jgi:hypothetical protein